MAGGFHDPYDLLLRMAGSFHDPYDWSLRMAGSFHCFLPQIHGDPSDYPQDDKKDKESNLKAHANSDCFKIVSSAEKASWQ